MKKLLLKELKRIGFAAFLFLNSQQLKAQYVFGSLFTGDPENGFVVEHATANPKIVSGAKGEGEDFIKTKMYPLSVIRDGNNNIAIAYNSQNRILRKDDGQDNIVIIPLLSGGEGGALRGITIDKDNEFLYYSAVMNGAGRIYSTIWKNDGTCASVGYYANQPLGTPTTDIQVISFIKSGNLFFINGSTERTAYNFGQLKGMAFDNKGSLYVADISHHRLDKISILKKAAAEQAAFSTNITLADVSGLKNGDLVSGQNIPEESYIGAINGNTITLVDSNNAPRNIDGAVRKGGSLVFVTGIYNIAGNGTEGAILGNTAGTSQLNIPATENVGIGLTFNRIGDLFIGDVGNSRILKIKTVNGEISEASPISVFISETPNVRGIAIDRNNNFYFTNSGNSTVYLANPEGNNVQILAGSGVRLSVTVNNIYSLAKGSNVVQMHATNINATSFLSKTRVGMYIRSSVLNGITGAKVVAIDLNVRTITLNMNAARDVAFGSGLNNSATLVAVTEDGFIITETDKGYLDGCSSLISLEREHAEDLVVADGAVGFAIRVLKKVEVLPVTLSGNLEARLNTAGVVDMYWQTASEQENSHFIIKRSTDGINYKQIAFVKSKGATGAGYYTTDINPVPGVNYYQLSQIDRDGTIQVLGIEYIRVVITKDSEIEVYPNPVKNKLFTIRTGQVKDNLSVALMDLSGQKVFEDEIRSTGSKGYYIRLPQKIRTGIYMLYADEKYLQKLVIE